MYSDTLRYVVCEHNSLINAEDSADSPEPLFFSQTSTDIPYHY